MPMPLPMPFPLVGLTPLLLFIVIMRVLFVYEQDGPESKSSVLYRIVPTVVL